MDEDYWSARLSGAEARAAFPPRHTRGPTKDPFPYRGKPGLTRQLTGGRDPWPMRSQMPDVRWLIDSRHTKPESYRPQRSQRSEPAYVPGPLPFVPFSSRSVQPVDDTGLWGAAERRRRGPFRF